MTANKLFSRALYVQILIVTCFSGFAISGESSVYGRVERGSPNTFDHRIYISNADGIVSAFHDIPLYANVEKSIVHMVVEIPKWTNAKMETSRDEKMNPLKQDTKNGKLRYIKNIFPHHGYIWNYGGIPQTWENPEYVEPSTNTTGDNDPVDAMEIGTKVHKVGAVIQVKVLGTMALIDDGETDWKTIVIDVNDELADQLNDVQDIERLMPGYLTTMTHWLRTYKFPDLNHIAFDGVAQDRATAMRILRHSHDDWWNLVHETTSDKHGISSLNTAVPNSPYFISTEEANLYVEANPALGPAADLPDEVDRWQYVDLGEQLTAGSGRTRSECLMSVVVLTFFLFFR